MYPSIVAGLVLLVAVSAAAQDRKLPLIEVDGLAGYTAVKVENWAQVTPVEKVSRLAAGIVVRGFLTYIGSTQVGLEVGTQRLFSYASRRALPGQIITEEATVAGFHVLAVGRFVELARFSWDLGAGWFALGDVTVPGLMTNFNYALLRSPRFSVPIGARVNLLLNDPMAATVSAKIGIAIPLTRETNESTSR